MLLAGDARDGDGINGDDIDPREEAPRSSGLRLAIFFHQRFADALLDLPVLDDPYAVAPPSLLRAFVTARYLMDRQPSSLCQAVVAAFMAEGHFAAHIRRMREMYRNQRDTLVAALRRRLGDQLTVDPPDQGMHLVAYLRRGLSDVAIERAARNHGVVVRAMSRLYVEAPAQSALMLGFSGYPQPLIAPAIGRLARAVER